MLGEELAPPSTISPGFFEPPAPFERPIVEMTVLRPFRERSFMHNVRAAYANRCAITGLRLINGGGRPEVQAAHIQPRRIKRAGLRAKWLGSLRNGALDVRSRSDLSRRRL